MTCAGVLGLPYAFAALGWAGGAIVLVASLLISMYSFILLVHLHEVRHHVRAPTRAGEGRAPWGEGGPQGTARYAATCSLGVQQPLCTPGGWHCNHACAQW